MFKTFQQPFPAFVPNLRGTFMCFIAGCCVFLVLFVFGAFGMHNLSAGPRFYYSTVYAGVTFIISVLNCVFLPWMFPGPFKEEKWTVGKEILFFVWILFCVSAGNMFTSYLLEGDSINPANFLKAIGITTSVGIIPISISILVKQQTLLKRYSTAARQIEENVFVSTPVRDINSLTVDNKTAVTIDKNDCIELSGDNSGEKLSIPLYNLLYINAADNYIRIFYTDGTATKSSILRSTLKKTEESLASFPQFYRCHRTYLVNLQKVKHISGNAQGYKLHLAEVDDPIPVSRSLNNSIAMKLTEAKQVSKS
jgi:LytTr DNA-binding domain